MAEQEFRNELARLQQLINDQQQTIQAQAAQIQQTQVATADLGTRSADSMTRGFSNLAAALAASSSGGAGKGHSREGTNAGGAGRASCRK